MKYLLTGNGINIQFDKDNYTTQQIVLRILQNCDRDDFPRHIIVNDPYLLKNYLGQLYLEARELVSGNYDKYVTCSAERNSLQAFKEQYSSKIQTLRITDICFEDYYLIHDLVCHKHKMGNPEQFYIREAMRIAYLMAIYNDGKLNALHDLYPNKFCAYLNEFNSIFTTNYDSNIDAVVSSEVIHIHGQFDKLSTVYDADSFRNKLPDCPIKENPVDENYWYLYSNALTTHCGEYKEFQIRQEPLANEAIEKMAAAYATDPNIRAQVDGWTHEKNIMLANMGYAIQLKSVHPEWKFPEDYHFDKLRAMTGELQILGLSPWNDFHIFETIDASLLSSCIYYFYSEEQCNRVKQLLPKLCGAKKISFLPVKDFWRQMYEE